VVYFEVADLLVSVGLVFLLVALAVIMFAMW
jgi:hypothetical protein